MESSLEKLNQQEIKYTAELDSALTEYVELQQQAEDIDAAELDTARQIIRPGKEHDTVQRLQNTYGKRFDSGMLARSRKDVAEMLDEGAEPVSIHQKLQQSYRKQDKWRPAKERGQEL